MKNTLAKYRNWIAEITASHGDNKPRSARLARFMVQLCRFSLRRLKQLNASAMASALSFRTFFALIPMLVLSLMIMSALGIVENRKESLRNFLDTSGIGQITVTTIEDAGKENSGITVVSANPENANADSSDKNINKYQVADKIEEVVSDIQEKMTSNAVGAVGIVLMIWAAIALLVDMEKSLNRIFEARFHRSLGKRMMLYWSVVTLLPIIQSAAVFVGSKTQNFLVTNAIVGNFIAKLTVVFPIVGGIFIVSMIYWLMPNTKTKFSWALFGATVIVPIWFITKWLFGLYVTKLVGGKDNMYGNLGLLPLLLLWVNTSWLLFLYGAVIAHISANISVMESSDLAASISLGPLDILATTMAIAGPFARNEGPVGFKTLRNNLHLPDDCIKTLIDMLVERRIICPVDSEYLPEQCWLPARPLESINLLEVTGLSPENSVVLRDISDSRLKTELSNICDITKQSLADLTLAQATVTKS